MVKIIIFLSLCVSVIQMQNVLKNSMLCSSKQYCGECIQELGCIWCSELRSNLPIGKQRHCISKNEIDKYCDKQNIVNPRSKLTILKNEPLQTNVTDKPVQLRPQKIKLRIKQGETLNVSFTYSHVKNYPVDLYFVMDISRTMKPYKESLARLGRQLVQTMESLTGNLRLGFGSFVDKPEMPFVFIAQKNTNNTYGSVFPYGFKNHLSLPKGASDKFYESVNQIKFSGNNDEPEGGLDALLQIMVCKEKIGWRSNARRLVVFSTDSTFHIAGDGKIAGIVEPNDGQCHLEDNEYTHSVLQDYPSIGQLTEKAKENDVNVLFAVNEAAKHIYEALKETSRLFQVGILSNDSSNVVELVKENFNNILHSVSITDDAQSANNYLEINYFSSCNGTKEYRTDNCSDISYEKEISFKASITLNQCPMKNFIQELHIRPIGLQESLLIEVEMLCECPCEQNGNKDFMPLDKFCTNSGNKTCGVCRCNPGKYGEKCECDDDTTISKEDKNKCRRDTTSPICSALGTCKCGKCECNIIQNNQKYTGEYCECNNYDCKESNGEFCSGPSQGVCECSQCKCKPGWTGDACECPENEDSCKNNDGLICSGRGACECGQCHCNQTNDYFYSGQFCEECLNCPDQRCKDLKYCAECTVFLGNDLACQSNCTYILVNVTENFTQTENKTVCRFADDLNCILKFIYFDVEETTNVFVQQDKTCPQSVFQAGLLWTTIIVTTIIGLLLICLLKIYTYLKDKQEYTKFLIEKEKSNWNTVESPLYKDPNTHFKNPLYSPEDKYDL